MAQEDAFGVVKKQFDDWVLGDIQRAINGGALVGAFILIGCGIDTLSTYRANSDSNESTYEDFVRDFFPPTYDAELLYRSLRCGLVHNYSTLTKRPDQKRYVLTDAKPQLHLCESDNQIALNLEDLFRDFKAASETYFAKVKSDPALLSNLAARYSKASILQLVEFRTPAAALDVTSISASGSCFDGTVGFGKKS